MNKSLLQMLACPRDYAPLKDMGSHIACRKGHEYPVVDGIPIFLLSEEAQTHVDGTRALAADQETWSQDDGSDEIDPYVSRSIAATNGALYVNLVGKLTEYPIPALRLPPGDGKLFLEIGCNWGRWCVAAARAGYRPIGIDPSLKSIRAARHVARQLGVEAEYLVGDGRHLPFAGQSFDQVFSYSVLQHLSKENARLALREATRVLKPSAGCLVQMPQMFGIRCLYHQIRRGFRETRDFEVRYWTVPELVQTFREIVGPAEVFVDGYFSLNPQMSDLHLLPRRYRALVRVSEQLRKLSTVFSPLVYVADSLYVSAVRS